MNFSEAKRTKETVTNVLNTGLVTIMPIVHSASIITNNHALPDESKRDVAPWWSGWLKNFTF